MSYFAELGRRIERAWSIDRDEERFVDVAFEALSAFSPQDNLDLDAFIDDYLDPERPVSRQHARVGAFGQPGITAHHGRGFVVDVYFWTDSLSGIHNHPFCGVFTILRGHSVEARYRFDMDRPVGPRMQVGDITLDQLRIVRAGHVSPFSLRDHPLVHALIHVPVPSVSMVVRTTRTVGYLRYYPPGYAISADPLDDSVARPIALLDTLVTVGGPKLEERLLGFLSTADLEATFLLMARVRARLADPILERARSTISDRHGDAAAHIPMALDHPRRSRACVAMRAKLARPVDRLLVTTLMLAESRSDVLSLLDGEMDDPIAALTRLVDRCYPSRAGEEVSVVAHALVQGHDLETTTATLVDRCGSAAIEARSAAIGRFFGESPLSVLAR